jgi:hypothetical protein
MVVADTVSGFKYTKMSCDRYDFKDGLTFTLLAWVIMTKFMKRESWEWYNWLNALAYTTVIARIVYVAFFN